ncbi:hypothetical protein AAFF_G00143070 [Aldrovandia affinis]|uniref:Gypsy retrotransposon integrase-like protein 1 n=1 Tax=Aldrovandia affinis TaxID=143900 RepID=A0AAD7T0A1_9TELE|nr:hypothetical protein AAFF_G00143070 [Aldrovandia affinis]
MIVTPEREELALHAFLQTLTPERLRQYVVLATPRSLDEALKEAERAEDVFCQAPGQTARPRVREVDCYEEEEEEVRQQRRQRPPPVRRGRCYRCDEPGHLARDCPAPAPLSQEPILLNQDQPAVPETSSVPLAKVKIPSAFVKAGTEQIKFHPALLRAAEQTIQLRVGRLGKAGGLYLHCRLDGQSCWALVDTGATISLVQPGTLPNTTWAPTTTELQSVTGQRLGMRGKKMVSVEAGNREVVVHEFWLADISDACILGLDLLAHWGATVDIANARLSIGATTLALHATPKRKYRSRRTRGRAASARPHGSPPQPTSSEGSRVEPEVAAVYTISEAGWLPVSPEQLREGQEADGTLRRVRGWLEAGQPPQWAEVSAEGPKLKVYYDQWRSFELWDGLAYRRWQAPGLGNDLLQLLVPRALRTQVLGLVHGLVGAGHFGNRKTLRRLRGRFYWAGCHRDVELRVRCSGSCAACKGSTRRSHAPPQWLRVARDFSRQAQDTAGLRQKRAYDHHCKGQTFKPGDRVWVHCPVRKKGLSPKLQLHWRGRGAAE